MPDPAVPLLREKAQLMSASEIERTLVRLAHEIVEKNDGVDNLALIGIRRRGEPLARRLAALAGRIESKPVPVGTLDITYYRDDLSSPNDQRDRSRQAPKPLVKPAQIDFDINGLNVILVDDVLYTGRTIRAALDALFDHGRPRRVQLCALIDRGHRELPIEASFVGKYVHTAAHETVQLRLHEIDAAEKVLLMEPA
ncbi:MAG TPA: bifunctional pyr operon transcriptional regulator/uracil phosphoribosyltransferase PyrR [Terriglobales bacterium]|nr:bifunctional pyr operon transcriptional regulator/uracil phosphoribosyltransferase PyrR [Terriglobales bacterium]